MKRINDLLVGPSELFILCFSEFSNNLSFVTELLYVTTHSSPRWSAFLLLLWFLAWLGFWKPAGAALPLGALQYAFKHEWDSCVEKQNFCLFFFLDRNSFNKIRCVAFLAQSLKRFFTITGIQYFTYAWWCLHSPEHIETMLFYVPLYSTSRTIPTHHQSLDLPSYLTQQGHLGII